jgi:hypothetical protein
MSKSARAVYSGKARWHTRTARVGESDKLARQLARELKAVADPVSVMTEAIVRARQRRGRHFSSEEKHFLRRIILAASKDKSPPRSRLKNPPQIRVGKRDFDRATKAHARITERYVKEATTRLSLLEYQEALQSAGENRRAWFENKRIVEFGIDRQWGKPLSLLHQLIALCDDGVTRLLPLFDSRPDDEDLENPDLLEALSRLATRACLVSKEILVLLEQGFADGAMARWRTLHELAVTAWFLANHGNDCAERYLAHMPIDQLSMAKSYESQAATGSAPTPEEMSALRAEVTRVCDKYGKHFETQYGWAVGYVPGSRPTFADVEASARMSHLRPYFKWANATVHSGAKGSVIPMGLPSRLHGQSLIGPSDFGLADPGQNCALSLSQCVLALLSAFPNADRLVRARIISKLQPRIGLEFVKVHKRTRRGENRPSRAQSLRQRGRVGP